MRTVGGHTQLPVIDRTGVGCAKLRGRGAALTLKRIVERADLRIAQRVRERDAFKPAQRTARIARECAIHGQRAILAAFPDRHGNGAIEGNLVALGYQRAEFGRIGIGRKAPLCRSIEIEIAFGFGQAGLRFGLCGQADPRAARDIERAGFDLALARTATERPTAFDLDRLCGEILLEDEVDHALVGREPVSDGRFFRQDFGPFDRFRREIAQLAKAGNAHAVQEDRGRSATSPAARIDRRAQLLNQFGDRTGAIGGDIGFIEGLDRLLRGIDLAQQARAADDHTIEVLAAFVVDLLSGSIDFGIGVVGLAILLGWILA